MIWTIIVFLLTLSVLVLAHEFGHYFSARFFGAKVEEFGIGFPPRAWSWKTKEGMKWSLNWIPIGGFVKIKGESGDNREDPDSFAGKSILARAVILCAGVFMNMLAAAVLLTIAMNVGIPAIIENIQNDDIIIEQAAIRITQVLEDSPAQHAGLEVGDTIISIGGISFVSAQAAREHLSEQSENQVIIFGIERDGQELVLNIIPEYIAEIDGPGVGAAMLDTGIVRYAWYTTPWRGVQATYYYTVEILRAFVGMIKNVFNGNAAGIEVSGPVGIAVITGEFIDLGFSHFIQFMAILSINLAIINILPFPALDGGRLAFLAIEAIFRKKVSAKLEGVVHTAGFLLLLVIIVLVTYKDIVGLL